MVGSALRCRASYNEPRYEFEYLFVSPSPDVREQVLILFQEGAVLALLNFGPSPNVAGGGFGF